jgi:hypothetical protein
MSDDYNDKPVRSFPKNGYKQNLGALAELANHPQLQVNTAIRPRSGLALFRAIMSDPMDYLDEEMIERIANLVRKGNYPDSAAASLGIPGGVWKRWYEAGQKLIMAIEDDPKLLEIMSDDEEKLVVLTQAVVQATVECEQEALGKIMAAGNFDWAACAWWLSKMHPEKWGRAREAVGSASKTDSEKISDNSGVLAVAAPLPVGEWLETHQEQKLETLDATSN